MATDNIIIDDSRIGIADHVVTNAPFTGAITPPLWLRYADDLVFVARSVTEGTQILDQARQLLGTAGYTLKGEVGPPVDLRTDEAQVLGFTVTLRDDRLQLGAGEASWRQLARDLEQALTDMEDPSYRGQSDRRGWAFACFGAAFVSSGSF